MPIAATLALVVIASLISPVRSSLHAQHQQSAMHERGARVMGFDQEGTVHHFHLYTDGGAIDVSVKDSDDKANLDAVRSHLPHIARMFGQGNFEAPMLVHQANVPGTSEMARLKERLQFKYAATPKGGRVDITTEDREALAAVHAFLRFQIADHATGDSTDVKKRPGSVGRGL